MAQPRRTPGVYVTEVSAFPPSVVGVPTAVPGFVGYTQKAEVSGKPVFLQPIRISSLADYQQIFGGEYDQKYKITPATSPADIQKHKWDFQVFDPSAGGGLKYYTLDLPANAPRFNLYNSLRLFYDNGGGTCYIVSVAPYENPPDGANPATPNKVDANQLIAGLNAIKDQVGPTMLVVPEAILLPGQPGGTPPTPVSTQFKAVVKAMLEQCAGAQDRFAILDIYGTEAVVDEQTLAKVIGDFRTDVDGLPLNYGAAYFPFVVSTVVPISDYDYTNIDPITDANNPNDSLTTILTWQNANLYNGGVVPPTGSTGSPRYEAVQKDIDAMSTSAPDGVAKINQNLLAALPLLGDILNVLAFKNDILPPSGAMAGVYSRVDTSRGVWNAPANVTLSSVTMSTYKLNDAQQGDLNLPVDGKAIDALREFTGRGTVVWGGRTLDGNSNDYRYIQVRRTLIYIEQSIKIALNQFVFAPNDANTWVAVVSMVSGFLLGLWQQGGLMGASPAEAFGVECGLGSTMTGQDILNGYMIVQVTLQMQRPAEFIELIFKQKMEGIA
jgi:phage tail sheath protein FI